jgi:tetratricopeptide (TPR) repeat protein
VDQYKAAMREVNCNFLGQSLGPGQPKRQQTKPRREADTMMLSGLTIREHAELKKREDDGRRSEQEAQEEEERRRQAELETAMRIKDSCGFHSLSADYVDEAALRATEGRAGQEEQERRRQEAVELKEAGNALYKAGKVEEALVKYTEGLKVCPLGAEQDRAVLYGNRAQMKRALGLAEHAVANCTKALQLNPKYLKVILRRGQILSETGRHGKDQDHYVIPPLPQTRLSRISSGRCSWTQTTRTRCA